MKLVYVSHPYTGDEKKNVKSARKYCRKLREQHPDWVIFNPLDNFKFAHGSGCTYDDYMRMDTEILGRCDIVVFCGKWRKSKGCMAEYREAEKLGLKIEVEGES